MSLIHSQDDHRNMSEKMDKKKNIMVNEFSLEGLDKVNFEQNSLYKSE